MDGQYFNIKIKKKYVSWKDGKPPSFHLWAKDREDLKRILSDKNIMIFEIDNIVEKGSDWDSIVK
tara:strand:+ start:209 stop:403 length:195 start_codon:yes stop_codon:yes gene_type:complete